jgi:hypothetical protein
MQRTQACQVRPPYLGQTGAVLRVPARNSGNTELILDYTSHLEDP